MLEVAVPLELFGLKAGEKLGFNISVVNKGQVQELHPADGQIELKLPDEGFSSQSWIV